MDFKEGDELLVMDYDTRGDEKMKGVVEIIKKADNTKVPKIGIDNSYVVYYRNITLDKVIYKPSFGISYTQGTYGDAVKYPTVSVYHTYKVNTENKPEIKICLYKNNKLYFLENNQKFSRKGYEFYTDEKAEQWLNGEYFYSKVKDPERVEELFAEHPEWEKEDKKFYNMSIKKENMDIAIAKQILNENGYILEDNIK